MLKGNSILVAVVILFFGNWWPVWSVAPKDIFSMAAQGTIVAGGNLQQNSEDDATAMAVLPSDQLAEATIGNYFIANSGFGILVNDHYYGAEITDRFFNSIALSWIALFLALSMCGVTFFFIF